MADKRCPFRVKAFDQPDTCDKRCSWLLLGTCSVKVLAVALPACAAAIAIARWGR